MKSRAKAIPGRRGLSKTRIRLVMDADTRRAELRARASVKVARRGSRMIGRLLALCEAESITIFEAALFTETSPGVSLRLRWTGTHGSAVCPRGRCYACYFSKTHSEFARQRRIRQIRRATDARAASHRLSLQTCASSPESVGRKQVWIGSRGPTSSAGS